MLELLIRKENVVGRREKMFNKIRDFPEKLA